MIDIGDRVLVNAGPREGTDHDYHGRTGTVLDICHLGVSIKFDDPPRLWPQIGVICRHNLRPA